MTKRIEIPLIQGLESLPEEGLKKVLTARGSIIPIEEASWEEAYPEKPSCRAYAAATQKSLCIRFEVRERSLRVQNLSDNLRQWEDSCCEVFLQTDGSDLYYNFEINPLGKILAASGPSREGRRRLSEEKMATIVRHHGALPAEPPLDIRRGVHDWDVTVLIPFALTGLDSAPKSLKANFYKCGDLTANPHFLSWNRIGTPSPDFHRPEYFGIIDIK